MRAIALSYSAPIPAPNRTDRTVGSTEMQTMHEALAREHMRQRESEAQRFRLDSEPGRRRYLRPAQRQARRAHRVLRGGAGPAQHSASAE
jgi:hypothetical protein